MVNSNSLSKVETRTFIGAFGIFGFGFGSSSIKTRNDSKLFFCFCKRELESARTNFNSGCVCSSDRRQQTVNLETSRERKLNLTSLRLLTLHPLRLKLFYFNLIRSRAEFLSVKTKQWPFGTIWSILIVIIGWYKYWNSLIYHFWKWLMDNWRANSRAIFNVYQISINFVQILVNYGQTFSTLVSQKLFLTMANKLLVGSWSFSNIDR